MITINKKVSRYIKRKKQYYSNSNEFIFSLFSILWFIIVELGDTCKVIFDTEVI